jgi:uracil phosphoribosyltransferase
MPDVPPNVVLFDHPLIQHKLTWLRERSTSSRAFRALMAQIAGLMVYEVTRGFPSRPVEIRTPMETMAGTRLEGTITVVPVLRAGLGMAEGVLDVMPEARVGHLGMARGDQGRPAGLVAGAEALARCRRGSTRRTGAGPRQCGSP